VARAARSAVGFAWRSRLAGIAATLAISGQRSHPSDIHSPVEGKSRHPSDIRSPAEGNGLQTYAITRPSRVHARARMKASPGPLVPKHSLVANLETATARRAYANSRSAGSRVRAGFGDERDSVSAFDRTTAAVTLPTYSATPRRHRDDRWDRCRPPRGPGQGARPAGWVGRRPRQPRVRDVIAPPTSLPRGYSSPEDGSSGPVSRRGVDAARYEAAPTGGNESSLTTRPPRRMPATRARSA
jgi:hypothetical protein